jgi:biotin carboxyl carrier protein
LKRKFKVSINDKSYEVEVEEIDSEDNKNIFEKTSKNYEDDEVKEIKKEKIEKNPKEITEKHKKEKRKEEKKTEETKTESFKSDENSGYEVKAPLPGLVNEINVREGQTVKAGDKLLIIEAMKMENEIPAEYDGVVEKILVKRGDSVEGDQILMIIK